MPQVGIASHNLVADGVHESAGLLRCGNLRAEYVAIPGPTGEGLERVQGGETLLDGVAFQHLGFPAFFSLPEDPARYRMHDEPEGNGCREHEDNPYGALCPTPRG